LAYRLAHEIKYKIVFVRDAGFLSPSGADRRTIRRGANRHAACQRMATTNMDPFPILRAGAFVTTLAEVVHSSPGIFLSPTQYTTTRVSFSQVRARYSPHFEGAVRMSDGAFHALVGILRPRLPRPGLSAEIRTALALRYMSGGSYVDMCAAFGVHSASVYRHCGQLPCRAPGWVFPTEGGWGGTVRSLKGRQVGRAAANSAMQRGASRVGCGARVNFSGPFAAACVARVAHDAPISGASGARDG